MESTLTTLVKDFFHAIGFHSWYYSKIGSPRRACVRCGIIQKRGYLSGKWINER